LVVVRKSGEKHILPSSGILVRPFIFFMIKFESSLTSSELSKQITRIFYKSYGEIYIT